MNKKELERMGKKWREDQLEESLRRGGGLKPTFVLSRDKELKQLELEKARAEKRAREEAEEAERRRVAMDVAREKQEADNAYEEAMSMKEQEKYDKSLRGKAANVWSKFKGKKSGGNGGDDNGGDGDGGGNQARGSGGSPFPSTFLLENVKNPHFWRWVAGISALLLLAWWTNFLKSRDILSAFLNTFGFTLLGLITVIFMLCFIVYGFATCKDNPAKGFIAAALLIWMLDLASEDVFLIGQYLGPVYQGFEFPFWPIQKVLSISLIPILASSFTFALFYVNMVYNIIKKEYIFFLLSFAFIIISNYSSNQLPTYARFNFNIPYGQIGFVLVLILLGVLAWKRDRQRAEEEIAGFFTYLYMAFVLSFFWLNTGWQGNVKAWIHAVYIIAFGFGYIKPKSDTPYIWHLLIPSLLLIDFYGYGLLYSTDNLALQFIPPLVIFVIGYCYEKEAEHGTKNYNYPVAAFILLVTFILLMSVSVGGTTSAEVPFVAKKGADYKDFFTIFKERFTTALESRLEFATGGYYRGNVEKNQYESLGVYFSNIRAADPRFYTDEPITVWGTIRSKTYQDAVVINFSCYRLQNNKRILADKIIPDFKFPIATLEDIDTECTFLPKIGSKDKEIKPGINSITFSADYNFGTDAYLKTYFIDKDRFRAGAREGFDTEAKLLQSYGIKDTKPIPIFTNGPVEIGMQAGPLVTVSEGYTIKPTIGISLLNRQEIQDKDKNIITRWEGKIKNITELVLLVPPGIEIPTSLLESCKSRDSEEYQKCPCNMPFGKYEIGHCTSACKDLLLQCSTACVDSYKGTPEDVQGRVSCINECKTSGTNCEKECEFLFSTSGEENLQGSYKGYALDVGSIQFRDLNKDIDKARSFQCRFDATPAVLDATPITTRYFRVRARYNYLVENSVQVNVEVPIVPLVSYSEPLYNTAIDAVKGTSFEPDLIIAIAYVESGLKHCCQEAGKTSAKTCVRSNEERCKPENTLTSGTSYGIMQVRYDTAKVKAEVDKRVQRLCKPDETIFDYECNIKVGADILKEKSNIFEKGCKETEEYKSGDVSKYKTLINACNTCASNTGTQYSSYTGVSAALRGYNGYGCDARFDRGYVEKVWSVLKKIKNGQIDDANIKQLLGNREGQGMVYDENIETRQDIELPS